MNNAVILNQIVKGLKTLNQPNIIYVLKGFNFLSEYLTKNNFLFSNNDIILDLGFNTKSSIKKLAIDNQTFFIWYEDFLLLEKQQKVEGIKDFTNYDFHLVENNFFFNYYPDFNTPGISEKLIKYNDEHDNLVQFYYGDFLIDNNQAFLIYNDMISKNIPRTKISDLLSKIDNLNNENIAEIPEEIDNISFAILVKQILFDTPSALNILQSNNSRDKKTHHSIQCLRKIGLNIILRQYATPNYKIKQDDYNYYEKILQRKNSNFKFKNIKIYSNPYDSNELIDINQSMIIDRIIKNVESSQRGESFRDIFVTAPTGAGKSVMFQIPAIAIAEKHNLLTLVVTPLIGLMNDQVVNIRSLTAQAATINSDYTPFEKEQTLEKVKNGEVSILYLSPESLLSNTDITNLIGDRKIGLIVIDEAHIVATWGKSFRPDYWYLGDFVSHLRNNKKSNHNFPIATFTATATFGGEDNMYSDIIESLRMTAEKFIGNVKRDDITFDIRHHVKDHAYKEEKISTAAKALNKLQKTTDKTLVYVPYTRHITDLIAKIENPNKVGRYHGGMSASEKNEALENIKTGQQNMIIATKAFGMGIDIDDIKNVYHFAPTGNIADYVQEIGRAARKNGMIGVAHTDFYKEDFRYINQLYGISSLKNWQISAVLEKIFSTYQRYNKRNFLISPMDFSYIFNDTPPDEVDGKLKTSLLIIKRDFEIQSNSNYIPLIFKPRSMFTNGYFMVNDDMIYDLKKLGVWKYFTKLDLPRKFEIISDKIPTTVSSPGDTYVVDFKKIWERHYKDLSFASFKHNFFANTLGQNFRVGEKLIPRTIIEINSGEVSFKEITDQIILIANGLQNVFDALRQSNKHFTIKELSEHILNKTPIKKPRIAIALAQSIIHILNRTPINNMCQSSFATHNSQTDKWSIKNTTYETRLRRLVGGALRSLPPHLKHTVKFTGPDLIDNLEILIAQLLEILEIADVKISNGNNPEFFIRVNSPSVIENIVRNKNYRSKTVSLVNKKHKESCQLMEKFFTQLSNDKDRWEFIEKFFLGKLN